MPSGSRCLFVDCNPLPAPQQDTHLPGSGCSLAAQLFPIKGQTALSTPFSLQSWLHLLPQLPRGSCASHWLQLNFTGRAEWQRALGQEVSTKYGTDLVAHLACCLSCAWLMTKLCMSSSCQFACSARKCLLEAHTGGEASRVKWNVLDAFWCLSLFQNNTDQATNEWRERFRATPATHNSLLDF